MRRSAAAERGGAESSASCARRGRRQALEYKYVWGTLNYQLERIPTKAVLARWTRVPLGSWCARSISACYLLEARIGP